MKRRRPLNVQCETDRLLVTIWDQFDVARFERGVTIAEMARASGIAKSCLMMQRKTLSNPSLATIVAQAIALGGHIEIAFVPNGRPR